MPFEERRSGSLGSPGPYLAEVTNHLDPSYMGRLEVALFKGVASSVKLQQSTYIVNYLSPFAGSTSIRYTGNNSSSFNDVQKSYGMWMVPPDVGSTVMVIFIDGDPNQGYWMGCVMDAFANHMVPGIAASNNVEMTSDQREKYDVDTLPVAEYLKKTETGNNPNIENYNKPVHPFADRLLKQGLLADTVRGVTSSGARREVPSAVFGISTPGPVDKTVNAKRGNIGYGAGRPAPVSRLGGTTFVMDDGDIDGNNELVRIRTRTGHQILFHNTQDLIYIGNSSGSSWIELSSAGKIDIYAEDSVSIHTKADFNFRAERDVNIEAGRNINMRAIKNMETNVTGFHHLIVGDYAKHSVKNDFDFTVGQTARFSIGSDLNVSSTKNMLFTAGADMNLGAVGNMNQGAGGDFSVGASGNYKETAAKIDMNGPQATSPAEAAPATVPPLLPTFSLPNVDPSASAWKGSRYRAANISSIMQRVPTHEPYPQHENINPALYNSAATDITLQSRASSGIAGNPNAGSITSANQGDIVPGTCTPEFAKDINASASQSGITAIKTACGKLAVTATIAVSTVLAIAGGESRWQPVEESFNYTTAARLLEVFPSVFKGNTALAQKYVGNPNNSLPEFLYGASTAKGQGLGNSLPGDGAKFIGRGYIQLTGRANYTKYSRLLYQRGLLDSATALVDNPELALRPDIAALIAVEFCISNVALSQNDPGFFDAAVVAVGYNTPDILIRKSGYYQCFLGQLGGTILQSGSGSLVTDSAGNPIKTGVQ